METIWKNLWKNLRKIAIKDYHLLDFRDPRDLIRKKKR